MDGFIPILSREYALYLMILIWARGMDFFSTWVATPNLVLEANPISKRLGWKLGIPVNIVICVVIAAWPLPALIITTASILVAARNFQSAWLMRSMGEEYYRSQRTEQLRCAPFGLFAFCILAQSLLYVVLGAILIISSNMSLIPFAIGAGMIAYALVVLIFSLLSAYRIKRTKN
ncbi:MAG: hypothetical protein K9N48_02140 [Verrucomicrobia bacterium]|nr:hypothetical protein [Verrucomicrobiota bacterium]MCF7708849.1 hypothetical protein [Verrucomicrobiota bacterium]